MGARPKQDLSAHPVYPLAQKKWQASGLTDDHAELLHLRPLTAEEVLTELKAGKPQPCGVQIPYFDFAGKPTEFFRIRYLEPPPGFAGLVEKPQRYAQPAKTLNEVYLPPLMPVSWADIAEDVNVPIYITEGEFKAACACAHGLACIGLGGVDVFRSTKRGIDILPQLAKIKWNTRTVVIIYDSDAATNPNVVRAQRALAGVLLAKGAMPAVASLPPSAADGGKQGLDDLLVAEGPDALIAILQDAPRFPEADALWGMNEDVLYVRDPGIVVEIATGQRLDPGRFVSHHYANRHYIETMPNPQGVLVAKRKKLAPRWIEWEHRSEVSKLTYKPGERKDFEGCYNTWPGWGCVPVKGDVSPWQWLLDHMFKGEPEARAYFEQWCAYPIQNPGAKLYAAALLWGTNKGTGKTFTAYSLMGIYGRNAIEIKNKDLKGGFNSWAENKQFIYGDEISGNEARVDAEWLKGLITQSTVRINAKFMPEFVIPDCMNYLFTSNKPDALFVEDDDRRYFVHEVRAPRIVGAFRDRIDTWLGLRGGVYHGPGAARLFHHLLQVDLKGFQPLEPPPMTRAKEAMIINGKSDVGLWLYKLKEDPITLLRPLTEKAAQGCDLFTTRQLLYAYDPDHSGKVAEGGMGRALASAGFRQVNGGKPVRVATGVTRLCAIRNPEKWETATPKAVADHYNKFFGPDGTKY